MGNLQAPFPWFGGKRLVASEVWRRFGRVDTYIEPFAGSAAMLLANPTPARFEAINDRDRFVANFWRATKHDAQAVWRHADWPVNEADLEARHYWLVTEGSEILSRVLGDPEGYDVRVAGWWVWGLSCWIGSGFASGAGPWAWLKEAWVKDLPDRPGVNRQIPVLSHPHGVAKKGDWPEIFGALQARLRHVRVACGDWDRVTGPSVRNIGARAAVFLDPPYLGLEGLYTEATPVATRCAEWAREAASDRVRIAICGYDGDYDLPGWDCWAWKTCGGYGNQSESNPNASRERVYFSPACLGQQGLFGGIYA